MKNKSQIINEEAAEFIDFMGDRDIIRFMEILDTYYKMFDVEEDGDWVADEVGVENAAMVRMIRTCLLFSKIAELFSGKLMLIKMKFPMFYKRVYDHVRKNEKKKID